MTHENGEKHNQPKLKIDTLCIKAGNEADAQTGALTVPISMATTFKQSLPGQHKGYEYSRSGNPTRKAIEECIAALENAKFGFAFASGSSATTVIAHLLDKDDHIICCDDVYGGTFRYLRKVLGPCNGINVTFVNLNDPEIIRKNIKNNTKMIWVESPTNPTLKVYDIERISEIARELQLICVVDNTFATPCIQKPLDYRADIVVHSATKYINGHSDVVMGLIATNCPDFAERIKFLQNSIGAVPSPFDCYLALRGVKTLQLRIERQSSNALTLAKFLQGHPKVTKVMYPGLEGSSGHKVALKQMKMFGGMVSFKLKGERKDVFRFMKGLKVFDLAESLGCVESLANYPIMMTHAAVPEKRRIELGISDTLVRLSVGIEAVEDLLDDLKNALESV